MTRLAKAVDPMPFQSVRADVVFCLFETVYVQDTESVLDGQMATVLGFYATDGVIIQLDSPPAGYNPAIVISQFCLRGRAF